MSQNNDIISVDLLEIMDHGLIVHVKVSKIKGKFTL